MKFFLGWTENIVGKGENAGYQHFLLFSQCFQKAFFSGLCVNSLPSGEILDWSKLKAFADDKLNVDEIMISLSDRIKKIVGKGENAFYQHFLIFPQRFQKDPFPESLKVGIVW